MNKDKVCASLSKYNFNCSDLQDIDYNREDAITLSCLTCNTEATKTIRTFQRVGCKVCNTESKSTQSLSTSINAVLDKYPSLSKVDTDSVPSRESITLSCKKHGVITRSIKNFMDSGCPDCNAEDKFNSSLEDRNLVWITKFKEAHGDTFDYSLFTYSTDRIGTFICKIHGEFQRDCYSFIARGCTQCNSTNKFDYTLSDRKEHFLSRLKEVEHNWINVESCDFKSTIEPLTLECQYHGFVTKTRAIDFIENGCNNCYLENKSINSTCLSNTYDFVSKMEELYPNKFDYSLTEYSKAHADITIECKEHSLNITKKAYQLLQYPPCSKCNPKSASEEEVKDYVRSLIKDEVTSKRPVWLNGLELDIYLPAYNLAIEYNGSAYHHSSKNVNKFLDYTYKDSNYHHNKWKSCRDNNVNLLSIYDFYWKAPNKQKILKSKIRHYLKLDTVIYARKCDIHVIDNSLAYQFYDVNHLEGSGVNYKDSISYGLYYEDSLVMCSTIGKFYNQSSKSFDNKLHRICTILDHTVVGGISKLTKHMQIEYGKFKYSITLATGGSTLNYFKPSDITLRYFWVHLSTLKYFHRNYCQKNLLEKHFGVPLKDTDTEASYMESLGYVKVFDNGVLNLEI